MQCLEYWGASCARCADFGRRCGRQRNGTGARDRSSTPAMYDRSYEDNTMIRIMSALILAMLSAFACAAGQPLQLADGAPDRYIVVPGDTLWGISGTFLKEPWRWPEIWRMNREQIRNPHLIYPGEVIILDRDAQGNPMLRRESGRLGPQVYSEMIDQAIPAIPPNVIRPFLSDPLIVEAHALDSAARIIATQVDRVYIGNGDLAYVVNADPAHLNWQVYRNGQPLRDPESGEVLGYEAFYLGTARQVERGNPATFEMITTTQEVGKGDRLVPAVSPPLIAYVPHKPDFPVEGRVISVYGGVDVAGRGSIIAINRGASDGIEIGHVLALERNRVVSERDEQDDKLVVSIPPQRVALLFVFRIFDRISYGLVVKSEGTVEINDFVRTP